MSPNKKIYLVYIDILGFGPLASEIAEKKDIEASDVREKFLNTISEKVNNAKEKGLIIGIAHGRDDWILAVKTKKKLFYTISKILNHYTGYKDYKNVQLEIAIGVEEYDAWARLDGNKLVCEDKTIKYLKTNIIGEFHTWFKSNNGESIKKTFIIITDAFYNEMHCFDQNVCKKIKYEKGNFYYMPPSFIDREKKIIDFLSILKQERSDFSGAQIDRIFIPPDGYEEIKKTLNKNRIVFITGTAGYGKTYTAIRLLWEYYNNNYKPKWISGKEEKEREDVRKKLVHLETQLEPKNIIYFEDPFGKTKYERRDDLKERINHIINAVKNKENVYVIITSRKDVFEEFEKESYSVEEIKKFERELNILQPAYNHQKRKKMLKKWATEKECEWLKYEDIRDFIFKSIEKNKNLPTPLSIYDFVESTIKKTNFEEIKEKIRDYSGSVEKAFADEIIGMYDSGREDRIIFISLIFISENFEVDLVKKEYEKRKNNNSEDFENILKEEYRVTKRSFKDEKYFEFSHPSYSGSIKHILKHAGCRRIFWELSKELLINNEYNYVKRGTAEALGKIGDPKAVSILICALNDNDWSVRRATTQSLGEIGDSKSLKPLIDTLNDPDWSVRRTAAESLGKMGEPAIKSLHISLNDREWGVRRASARALGEIKNHKSLKPLIESLNDPDPYVQGAIVESLGKIGEPAIKTLHKLLKHPNSQFRELSASALGEIGNSVSVQYLIKALYDPEANVQLTAKESLAKIGNPAINPILIHFKNQYPFNCSIAVDCIVLIGEPAIELLIKSLEKPEFRIRPVIESLVKIGKPGVKKIIETALTNPDPDVKIIAITILGRIRDQKSVPPLIQTLKDPESSVREASAHSLGNLKNLISTEPLIETLKDEDPDVKLKAAEALGEIGDTKAVDPLIETLKDWNYQVKQISIKSLKQIGISSVKPLIETLKDEDPDVRLRAAEALGEIGDTKAVDPLIETLKDEDPDVRLRAAEALGEIGDTKAVDPLIETLKDEDPDVRSSAAEALGEIGDTKAVDPLIETLEDIDHDVQQVVSVALQVIADPKAFPFLDEHYRYENDYLREYW